MATGFAIVLMLVCGIRFFRTPRRARAGNLVAACAMLLGLALVILRHTMVAPEVVIVAVLIGTAVGSYVAFRVNMVQIPAIIALQNGAGGSAAFLVSFVQLTQLGKYDVSAVNRASGVLSLIIGAVTLGGSLVAAGKLANLFRQTPVVLPKHNFLLLGTAFVVILIGALVQTSSRTPGMYYVSLMLIVSAFILSIIFSIRVGGADMPVLISSLNAASGLAGAFCGVLVENTLLIACGATVAASGSILTLAMCKAMNRSLLGVFLGIPLRTEGLPVRTPQDGPQKAELESFPPEAQELDNQDLLSRAIEVAKKARRIVIVPGYGMALAQAQFEVVKLANRLEEMGKEVKFAVHPVAGRMPGHMNVLLAEAEVEYDKLCEMEKINPEFAETDLALIVGACDVVNPAAISVEGTPISGMPILMAHEAKHIVVCNFDEEPGYSGVENPIYPDPKTILLLGDARDTVGQLLQDLA